MIKRPQYRVGPLRAHFSTVADGNMAFNHGPKVEVAENRRRFLANAGIPAERLFVFDTYQSTNIAIFQGFPTAAEPKLLYGPEIPRNHAMRGAYDGAITVGADRSYLGIVAGDCLPLMLYCERPCLIGLVHIGLAGAIWRILEVVADALERCGGSIKACRFLIGPAIGPDEYDLSSSEMWHGIKDQAQQRDKSLNRFVQYQGQYAFFDLPGMVSSQLLELGARPSWVGRIARSTAASDSIYFSNFGHKNLGRPRGRFLAVVGPQ